MSGTLLAFDTATETMAVALRTPRGDFGVNAAGGALASAALLPCIRRLLGDAGCGWGDLDAIAFGAGPGAFTGLRTSCAVAQGLAWGRGLPLLPLDSLLVVADDAWRGGDGGEVVVAMDARMGEVYAGRYRRSGGVWHTVAAPALHTADGAARLWVEPPDLVAGSAIAAFGDRLGLPPALPRQPDERDRAAALLRLAQAAFDAGAGIDAAAALPLYLRDKVALTTREREAVRAAGGSGVSGAAGASGASSASGAAPAP